MPSIIALRGRWGGRKFCEFKVTIVSLLVYVCVGRGNMNT